MSAPVVFLPRGDDPHLRYTGASRTRPSTMEVTRSLAQHPSGKPPPLWRATTSTPEHGPLPGFDQFVCLWLTCAHRFLMRTQNGKRCVPAEATEELLRLLQRQVAST